MFAITATQLATPAHSAAFTEASPDQVCRWLADGQAVLIDVREPDEHARERIAGATLIPLSKLDPAQLAPLARPGARLVLHCRGGRRSADACRLAASLAQRGVQLVSMTGGIEAWKAAALPVECSSAAPSLSVMRQTQLTIGLGVLAGSALAWLVHPAFIGLAAFFGAGLVFAGATGTCGLATLLGKMPWNRAACRGTACRKPA